MTQSQRISFALLVSSVVFNASAVTVLAQRGGGSESDLLRRQEVRSELGLSETQITKLEEAQKNSAPGREFFEPFLKRISEAPDKETEAAVRAEMTAAVAKAGLDFKKAAVNVLNDDQKKKLRGVYLRSAGTRALADPNVAEEYGLNEEQIAKITELSDQRRTASRDLGFNATEEAREKFNTEWQDKFMALLTPEQKSRFEKESAYGEQPAASAVASNGQPMASGVQPGTGIAAPAGPVVGTFGGEIVAGKSKRVEEFSFNFRGAPWEQVLQMYADGAGLTLDLNQIPPGTFSHSDDNKYSARRTLDILNGYLLRKEYAMIENDGFLIVLNTDNGIPSYLVPSSTIEDLVKVNSDGFEVGEHQLVSVTFPLEGLDTSRMAQEVEAIVGPHGSLIALTESAILIVTDTGGSLRRINLLLTAAMGKSKPDAPLFKAYYLKNMDAEEAELQVLTQFGMRQGATNVSSAVEAQSRFQSRTQSQQPQQRGGAPAPTPATKAEPAIQIAADLRLNGLLVTGTAAQHKLVEEILASLDVAEGPNGEQLTRGRKGTYLEVYQVKSADAGEVTKTLTAMNIPGVTVVNEDRSNGRIHIMASERQHEEVAVVIRQLDGSGSSGMVSVIQLAQMDPLSAAATLRSLFYADGDDAPTIETDLYGRRLIVRGNVDQITQIKQVLADLGEDGTGVRVRGDGGTVRQYSLQGRNPEDFVRILKQAWDANETQKINIVIPNEPGPIRSRRTTGEVETGVETGVPEKKAETRDDVSANGSGSQDNSGDQWKQWKKPSNQFASVAASATDEESSNSNEASSGQQSGGSGRKGVDVIVYGNQLILSSPDEAELDRLEDMLDQLQQSMPFKPEYTVVYLK